MEPPGIIENNFNLLLSQDRTVAERTVCLTKMELERAEEIKRRVYAADNLRPVSDFECVQVALTNPRDAPMDFLLERIRRLQLFKEEYRILDTVEHGMTTIAEFLNLMPGMLVTLDFDPKYFNFCVVFDYVKVLPSKLQTPKDWRVFYGGLYYILAAMHPFFSAIREGFVSVCECDGVSWANEDHSNEARIIEEFWNTILVNYKEVLMFNSTMVMNIIFTCWRKIFDPKALSAFRIDAKLPGFEGRRLTELFGNPTQEMAEARLLERLQSYLTVRYQNERQFSFDKAQITQIPPWL